MTFDLSSFLIGVLVGGVVAFFLKLQALQRLDLHLKRIGLSLGIEGFQEETPAGVKIGDIGGNVSGDIAGRDINKTSNLYKTVEAALASARRNGSDGFIYMRRPERLQLRSDDRQFAQQLEAVRQQDDWLPKWIETCLSRPEFKRQIDSRIEELQRDGWKAESMTFDNIPGGLRVELEMRKPYRDRSQPAMAGE